LENYKAYLSIKNEYKNYINKEHSDYTEEDIYNNDILDITFINDNESLDEGKDISVINDNFKNKNNSDSNESKNSDENSDYHRINYRFSLKKHKTKI
jgi:hypothetical protein